MEILEEVLKHIPDKKKISATCFEGANIILYTKDSDFFLNNNGLIKKIVDALKKRIELRPDPAITMDQEKAKIIINKLMPKEAGVDEIIFDAQRSMVIIEAEKPGLAIGKRGDLLREIRKQTLWVPLVKRKPAIRSKIIDNIRHALYENSDYRRKFLDKVGKRIYGGWTREKKHEWIRVSTLGGGRQVGRSCFLLQTPESNVLMDCGVNIAADGSNAYPYLEAPEFDLQALDAVVCTHSHLDHSGFISWLYKMGYRGPVYCTLPTRDVSALLALDYVGIAAKEAKKGLYASKDVKEMVMHTICLDYEEVTDISPDIRLTLYNSGHTIGSAMAHLHIGNGLHNLLYTGDMKYLRTQLLEPAATVFPRLETLMIEATYGGKDAVVEGRKVTEDRLLKVVKETMEDGGKVLMPVLGVGRSQEVLLILEKAIREGKLEKIPIYIQGMVWDVVAIHTAYPDFLNKGVRRNIFHKDSNPFLSDIFMRVGSLKEQEQIINSGGPCVIMATSGMMTAGASVAYFKALADNPKNTLMFTCWQGEGSLGRRIQNGEKEVLVSGEKTKIPVRMKVETFAGLTGHSDRNELTRFVYNLDPKPKRVIVNHGESSRCLELASALHKMHRIETSAPKNLETIRLR